MNESADFIWRYRDKGALFDANLLLVYVVGKTSRKLLSQLQHTKQYERDFPLIERLVEYFPVIYTTPNVLTEVSNLGKKLGSDFFETFSAVIQRLDDRYYESTDAALTPKFSKLGLTDAGLVIAAMKCLIITADFALYSVLRSSRLDAVNFNHLRPVEWAETLSGQP